MTNWIRDRATMKIWSYDASFKYQFTKVLSHFCELKSKTLTDNREKDLLFFLQVSF